MVILEYKIKKYSITLNPEIAEEYFKYLINSVYKSLTIFEGKDYKTRQVIFNNEVAIEKFRLFVQNFIYEVSGSYKLFNTKEFIILLSNLEEMLDVKANEHAKLRKLVFSCINTIESMRESD